MMSFSTTKTVVEQHYSSSGVILEAQTSLVTRGASLASLSYYPAEAEVCFPPCTAIDLVDNGRLDGACVIMKVALTTNPAAATIQKFVEERRNFVQEAREMVRGLLSSDLNRNLFNTMYHVQPKPEWYNANENLHADLRRMLNTVDAVNESLGDFRKLIQIAVQLHDKSVLQSVLDWGSKEGHVLSDEVWFLVTFCKFAMLTSVTCRASAKFLSQSSIIATLSYSVPFWLSDQS